MRCQAVHEITGRCSFKLPRCCCNLIESSTSRLVSGHEMLGAPTVAAACQAQEHCHDTYSTISSNDSSDEYMSRQQSTLFFLVIDAMGFCRACIPSQGFSSVECKFALQLWQWSTLTCQLLILSKTVKA